MHECHYLNLIGYEHTAIADAIIITSYLQAIVFIHIKVTSCVQPTKFIHAEVTSFCTRDNTQETLLNVFKYSFPEGFTIKMVLKLKLQFKNVQGHPTNLFLT